MAHQVNKPMQLFLKQELKLLFIAHHLGKFNKKGFGKFT